MKQQTLIRWTRLLVPIVMLAMSFILLTGRAAAADYVLQGSLTDTITYTLDSEGTLTITGTGVIPTLNDRPWVSMRNEIRAVVVSEGITEIGQYAFSGCSALTDVTLPASLEYIASNVFNDDKAIENLYISDLDAWCRVNCHVNGANMFLYTEKPHRIYLNGELMTKLVIPEGITSLRSYLFAGCKDLTEVSFPDSLKKIDRYAFAGCSGIKELTIPAGVTELGYAAFLNCTGVEELTICPGITVIGERAFDTLSNLKTLTIPEGVTEIQDYAFANCTGLESLTVPASLQKLGKSAFAATYQLSKLYLSDIGAWFGTEFADYWSSPFNSTTTEHAYYLNGNLVTELVIPEGVTEIPPAAFSSCTDLKKIVFPASLQRVGSQAFYRSTAEVDYAGSACDLWKIEGQFPAVSYTAQDHSWGNSVSNGSGALTCRCNACQAEYTINYATEDTPVRHAAIAGIAINSRSGLQLTLPAQIDGYPVDVITKRAFYGLGYSVSGIITELVIPEGIQEIGEYAFEYNKKLRSVVIPGTVKTIPSGCFSSDILLDQVTIEKGVTVIGDHAFYDCDALTEIIIPDGVTTIEYRAFSYCDALTSVIMGDSVSVIEQTAFENSPALQSVTLSGGLTWLKNNAFYDCTELKQLKLPATLKTIGTNAFGTWNDPVWGTRPVSGFTAYVHADSAALQYCVNNSIPYVVEAHLFTNYHYNNDAGVGKDGTETAKCSFCDAVDTRVKQGSALPDPNPENPFTDIAPGKFYYQPVLWAVERGVTSGMTKTTFAPDDTCTRGQVVTFLWRAAGKPEPKSMTNPFTDVVAGKFYYKAVLWAVENGITSGMTKTTFEPNSPCTRGQVVTFQWRAAGKPEPKSTNNPFTDVKDGKFYSKAVLWAVENKITSGMTKTTFVPDNVCTRGQIVTFLYRQYS